MAAPSAVRRPPTVRRGRNSNKHKRLFEAGEGALTNGEKVRADCSSPAHRSPSGSSEKAFALCSLPGGSLSQTFKPAWPATSPPRRCLAHAAAIIAQVAYITTQGEKLLEGEVVISARGPSGILCYCCNNVSRLGAQATGRIQ